MDRNLRIFGLPGDDSAMEPWSLIKVAPSAVAVTFTAG